MPNDLKKDRVLANCREYANNTLGIKAGQLISNEQVREWYHAFIDQGKKELDELKNLSLKDQAELAYDIRATARVESREMMNSAFSYYLIKARDLYTYGNSNGPTFQSLFDRNHAKGLSEDDNYSKIIQSSRETNPFVDRWNKTDKQSLDDFVNNLPAEPQQTNKLAM